MDFPGEGLRVNLPAGGLESRILRAFEGLGCRWWSFGGAFVLQCYCSRGSILLQSGRVFAPIMYGLSAFDCRYAIGFRRLCLGPIPVGRVSPVSGELLSRSVDRT
jgi:hypothetical protein